MKHMAEKKDNLTVAKMDSEARSMKAILDARPKRTIKLIDRDAAENKRTVPPKAVCINGYRYDVPWNKSLEVPDRVAEILEKQGLI
jgi:hypothetical protein